MTTTRTLITCSLALLGACVDPTTNEPAEAEPQPSGTVETAVIKTSEGIRKIGFERLGDGWVVFDGDILLSEGELERAHLGGGVRSAVTTVGGSRWPGGVIPFAISPALTNQNRVHLAIAHWHLNTPFRFVPRTAAHTDFVEFVPPATNVCQSAVGRQGGRQEIRLATSCTPGATIHEIGHAVGLFHEQTRHDRDGHVAVHLECIQDDKEANYEKYTTGSDVGPYDYNSIMHYGRHDFQAPNTTCEGLTPLDPQAPRIGQLVALSAGDIMGAFRIFNGVRPGIRAVPADYDGDGKADLALKDDAGVWRIDFAKNGYGSWDITRSGYGDATAIPVPADYDGDGKADLSVKNSAGQWFVDYASDGFGVWNVTRPGMGDASNIPVPADYDGDGKADMGVKNHLGNWFVRSAASNFNNVIINRLGYGNASAVPVPADYDGDGKADLSVKDSAGTWYVDFASSPQDGWNLIRNGYGDSTVIPVPADYDGDGKADFSVKATNGQWFIDYAASPQDGWNVIVRGYGSATSVPVPANYDGVDADGKKRVDLSVKATNDNGSWYIDRAVTGFGAWDLYKVLGV